MTTGIAASGARVSWFYAPETAGAISATTPAFKPLRTTGTTISESASELSSSEVSGDRHRKDSRRGTTTVAGAIAAELSFGTYDDLLQAVFLSTFVGTVLKTGTTLQTFSILKRNLDIGVDTLYTGCVISEMQLSCPLQEKITASFSVIGRGGSAYSVPVGATFASPTTTSFMTTLDGSLAIGGADFGAATALNLTLNNNMASKYSLFNTDAYQVKYGMIDATGDLSTYIEDDSLKTAWRSEAPQSFSIVLTDSAVGGNKYTISLPNAKFSGMSADSYNGDDLGIQQLQFRALLDATAATEISLTKTSV